MDGKKIIVLAVILVLSLGVYVTGATAQTTMIDDCADDPATSGLYVLTTNLVASETCLTVGANNVTIDLNGFTIAGDDDLNDIGISDGGTPRENIVIRNGTIRDCVQGINIENTDGCKVEGINAISGGAGIIVGNNCVVSHNSVINNWSGGILTGTDSTVSYNIANYNNAGILLNGTNVRSNIIYNTANGNFNWGINVACPSNLIGNTAQNNGTNLLEQIGKCEKNNNLFGK